MRIRTGWGPDDWTANVEDCRARLFGHGGRMLIAGDFVTSQPAGPSLSIPTPKADAGRKRRAERKRVKAVVLRELAGDPRPNTPRCAYPMPRGDTCARLAGHSVKGNGKGHRSRAALDHDNLMRQTA